jgi:hypothetical protein
LLFQYFFYQYGTFNVSLAASADTGTGSVIRLPLRRTHVQQNTKCNLTDCLYTIILSVQFGYNRNKQNCFETNQKNIHTIQYNFCCQIFLTSWRVSNCFLFCFWKQRVGCFYLFLLCLVLCYVPVPVLE